MGWVCLNCHDFNGPSNNSCKSCNTPRKSTSSAKPTGRKEHKRASLFLKSDDTTDQPKCSIPIKPRESLRQFASSVQNVERIDNFQPPNLEESPGIQRINDFPNMQDIANQIKQLKTSKDLRESNQTQIDPIPQNNNINATSLLPTQTSSMEATNAIHTSTVIQPTNNCNIKYYTKTRFSLMQFHTLHGKNIEIPDQERIIASLSSDLTGHGYLFSSRPLTCGEKIVLQVLGIKRSFVEGLSVGFTACSPDNVLQSELPDDSDLLLDRMEYWVVNKDVYRSPAEGDELCFHLTNDGEVKYSRNDGMETTLMHVDISLPLWIFFEIYGNVQKIKCLGVSSHQPSLLTRSRPFSYITQGPLRKTLSLTERQEFPVTHQIAGNAKTRTIQYQQQIELASLVPESSLSSDVHDQSKLSFPAVSICSPVTSSASPTEKTIRENENVECTICFDQEVNSALYKCGHACMCFECAIHIKDIGATCPICRQTICDVIKIFKS